jgi:hypothetical protein
MLLLLVRFGTSLAAALRYASPKSVHKPTIRRRREHSCITLSGPKIEVSALASANAPIVTDEELRKLHEIRQRLMMEQNTETLGHSPEPQ